MNFETWYIGARGKPPQSLPQDGALHREKHELAVRLDEVKADIARNERYEQERLSAFAAYQAGQAEGMAKKGEGIPE